MSLRKLSLCAVLLFAATGAFAQSADQEVVSVDDSADPVVPGQNVTYTVIVRNNGPDAAANGGLNVNLGSALTYVSNTVPPGWQCFISGNNISCITPSFTAGTTREVGVDAMITIEQGK